MKIDFEIKTRGSLVITYGDKKATISGELVFDPPTFYADIQSIQNWDNPANNVAITQFEKQSIIDYLTSNNKGTKIVFE